MVVEDFNGVPWCCSPKNFRTSSGCESHRCMYMFARAKWRFEICLFHCCETINVYSYIHHTFGEIERFNTIYIYIFILIYIYIWKDCRQTTLSTKHGSGTLKIIRKRVVRKVLDTIDDAWRKNLVTFTTQGWEAWLTIEPWSAMLYSRHESYDHADGITHDEHGSSNRCTFWASSGPTREWPDQIWILLDQCLGDSISGYATQEFVSDWAFQVCFMMLKYCEDSA